MKHCVLCNKEFKPKRPNSKSCPQCMTMPDYKSAINKVFGKEAKARRDPDYVAPDKKNCIICNELYQPKLSLSSTCLTCRASSDYPIKISIANRKMHRASIVDPIKAKGCSDCGVKFPLEDYHRLHFHHIDPSTKLFNVAEMMGCSLKNKLIWDEIAKCVLLCYLCHRKRHVEMNRESD